MALIGTANRAALEAAMSTRKTNRLIMLRARLEVTTAPKEEEPAPALAAHKEEAFGMKRRPRLAVKW